MRKSAFARSVFLAFVVFLSGSQRGLAQVQDVSDSTWRIVMPTAAAVDVDMGRVLVGTAKDSVITAYLTNTGSVAIRIDSIFFTGSDAGSFALASGLPPFAIPRGATQAVEFRFNARTAGVKIASVKIFTQADTLTRGIRGEGVLPQIEIGIPMVDFGKVKVNASKDTTITAVIRNAGGGTLTVSGTQQLGPDLAQFSVQTGGGAFSLAPGESRSMRLRFSPTLPGRTSGRLAFHHGGPGSPAVVELFGEGLGIEGAATLMLDTIRASAGELVEVPLYLRNTQDVTLSGAIGIQTELRFNASLLSPFGNTPKGSIANNERTIVLENIPTLPDAKGIVATLQFIAMLGDADGTPLQLEHSYAFGGKVALTEAPGYFLLSDVCREGGSRLFQATGTSGLSQNRPNPFNASTVIEYEVIENAPLRLVVMDLLGRTVSTLVDGMVPPGRYAVAFDASDLASGTYVMVLQMPTERLFRLMEVVK
ncbi:MAG: choice-of-anchor D domain-containing protein [Ignavibacteria bacterium]|nr:choice-of-anchor D domain-containing protein [Ignavibacteria bacterium]